MRLCECPCRSVSRQDVPVEATVQGLAALEDSRVRVKALPRAQGPAVAGVGGVRVTQAHKLNGSFFSTMTRTVLTQARHPAAYHTAVPLPRSRCFLPFHQAERNDQCRGAPRLPSPGEPAGEYLFRRTNLFGGEGLVRSPGAGKSSCSVRLTAGRAGAAESCYAVLTNCRYR